MSKPRLRRGRLRFAPRENPRLRAFLLSCGGAALVVGTLATLFSPPRSDVFPVWLQTTVIPIAILVMLVIDPRDRIGLLALTVGLLYSEALLTASLYTIGVSFAILIPLIGVGIVQPHLRGKATLAVYAGAGIVSTAAVALFALGVPSNPLNEPGLAVIGFGLLAAFALGLVWRAGERWIEALDAAARELQARVETERELGRTARLLQTLVGSSPLATTAIDADGTVRLWNPAARRLLGWSDDEIVGRHLPPDLIADDDSITFHDRLARTIAGDVIEGERVRARRKDGTEVLVEIHAAARRDDRGRPLGALVQMTDVTERAALEAQLLQAQKMEAVGHLAGGIAHDINNTLTAVGGFAELIEGSSRDPEITEDARTITAAVGRARLLTRQLLAFARRSVLQPQTIEVTRFVSSIEPMIERLLGSDVEVAVHHHIESGSIRVDPGQLEQAILNLAVNARDAMPGGGRLTIETKRVVRESVEASDGGSTMIGVAVSDTGAGIPADLREQVFEPFFTTKERGKGTGLGLAMVYGFVTQSGGEVDLQSVPGLGTTIEVRLPEALQESELPPPRAPAGTGTPGHETVLVVEDDRPVAALARQFLTAAGYRVLVAEDGQRAIELAAANLGPIDLVLSDVMMPGMRGPDVARAVRERHPEASVLYASGYSADAISERGILPPGVELIEKPYTSTELTQRVREVLDGHNRPDQAEADARRATDSRGRSASAESSGT